MCQIWIYGLLLIIAFTINQANVIPQSNAWIPLTKEEVQGRHTRTGTIKKDDIFAYFLPKNKETVDANFLTGNEIKIVAPDPIVHNDINVMKSEAIKLITPKVNFRFDQENVRYPVEPETVKSVNELQSEECNKGDCFISQTTGSTVSASNLSDRNKTNTNNHKENINERKSKTIVDDNYLNQLITESKHSDHIEKRVNQNIVRREDNRKQYRVTEDTADTSISRDGTGEFKTGVGYIYPPTPSKLNPNYPTKNNITNILLEILSKHNIRPEDDLPNYTLSRKAKTRDPIRFFMFVPIPLRIHPKFNNLNQLSVDPSLAVLMSNFGYYFPGSYGIHSRYRNLYGHLASNNIHNNKPFGSYKIFSDTDSSN